MRGANAAAGEHMGIGGAECARCTDDCLSIIADHTHFFEINALFGQLAGQVIHIGISGPSRQNFIANDEHRGCWIWHWASLRSNIC